MQSGAKATASRGTCFFEGLRQWSVQRFRLQRNILFAGGFFLRVFLHPCLPAFPGGGVATGERQSGNVGVADGDFFVRIPGVEPDGGIFQRGGRAAIEEIAFDSGAIFAGDGDVAAIVESLFQRDADFVVAGELRNPAFKILVSRARGDFERVGIGVGKG